MAQNNGYELDWDSTISADEQQYVVLPEGDYNFMVDHIDRSYVGESSERYAGAKMAVVYLNIEVPGQDSVQLKENFILHSNFAWKIGSLLVSTGLKKKGEDIGGNYWQKLPGTRGRCRVTQTAGKKNPDQKFNNVAKFYEPAVDTGAKKWVV